MKLEFEGGDDSDVAASATNPPEEVGVIALRRLKDSPIGGDNFSRDQVVNGQTRLPSQPAHAAAEREAANARVTYDAGRNSQPVRLGSRIEVSQGGSTTYERTSSGGVDRHVSHPAEIDLETVIDHRAAAGAVCSAANSDFQILLPGEGDGGADVSRVRAAYDDRWSPIDGAVPDDAGLVVARVAGNEHLSSDPRTQRLDTRTRDLCHVNLLLRPNPRVSTGRRRALIAPPDSLVNRRGRPSGALPSLRGPPLPLSPAGPDADQSITRRRRAGTLVVKVALSRLGGGSGSGALSVSSKRRSARSRSSHRARAPRAAPPSSR